MSELAKFQEPVLVVHGIGNRDQKQFSARVERLATDLGPGYFPIPIFWGELAASTQHLHKIISSKPPEISNAPPVEQSNALVSTEQPGFWNGLLTAVGDAIQAIGEAIQSAPRAVDEGLRSILRAGVSDSFVPYLGDIIVYQGMREQFHRAIRSFVPPGYGTATRPIKAIGHSLGGVMLFDLAVSTNGPPVWMDLVTLGSQASFFHLQHRRSDSVREYAGQAVGLPPMIRSWTNVLDDDDWLSFAVAPIFRLSNGESPKDRWVDNTEGAYSDVFTLAAHTTYWENPAVHAIVREAFGE